MPAHLKTFYILRHAKAQTADPATGDHERALTPKGRLASENLGAVLAQQGFKVARVLCSSSQRTRETVECLEAGLGRKLAVEYMPRLYLCSPGEMLNMLRALPDDVDSVMLVGHNPGMQQFCLDMAVHGDPQALEELAMGFPTCALAQMTVAVQGWKKLAFRQGTLVEYLPHAPVVEQV